MKARICLVEDDATIAHFVAEKLRGQGFEVDSFDSAEPLLHPNVGQWDLFIIDIMLAGEQTGLDLCRHLRQLSATLPILILSALTDPNHRVEGLKEGADDYLGKPFEMAELLLRVQGMLKRRSFYSDLGTMEGYAWGECAVDFGKLTGRRGKEVVSLSAKEALILKILIDNEGRVVSRDEILDKVWGYDSFPSTRTVDNFILRLRKMFEKDPKNPVHLQSVRGVGYKFVKKAE